jgi:hypothetical protein
VDAELNESTLKAKEPEVLKASEPAFVRDAESIKVKRHRRVTKRVPFAVACAAEIKCAMGTPKRNEANMLVVRRMANNLCIERRVRPTHSRAIIAIVVSLVFIPDEADILGAEILASNEANKRHYNLIWASRGGWWGALFGAPPASGQ